MAQGQSNQPAPGGARLCSNGVAAAEGAYWSRCVSSLCPAVVRSLGEAGEQLLTFYEFPKAMWRSLRTTNSVENLNREFRRRTKTQASFSSEESALTLIYGLVAFGQIRMRRIGHEDVAGLLQTLEEVAA